jgi:hypothetical protein
MRLHRGMRNLDRLSEILKQRVAAQGIIGSHPPAELLSAFAEQQLQPSERERVIDHLGTCSNCRAVVALATENVEEPSPKPAARPLSSRFRFPTAMRWASGTAALAVAIGIGLLIHQEQPRSRPEVQTIAAEPASPVASTQDPCGPTGAGCEPVASATKPAASNIPHRTAPGSSRPALAANAPSAQPRKALPQDSVADVFDARQQPSASAAGVGGAAYRPAPAAAAIAHSSPVISNQQLPVSSSDVVTQQASAASAKNLEVARESARMPASRTGSAAKKEQALAFNGGPIGGPLLKTPMAHWNLSVTGQLQRRNWDDTVTVVEPAVGATFRAVAAEGIEVWAAGSQAIAGGEANPVLFHSSDAGTIWKQVIGPWKTTVLRIQLGSAGVVTVSSAEGQWQTKDGGQTWIPRD